MNNYYVAMHIDGKVVPSSAIENGNLTKCRQVKARLMRSDKHASVTFEIYKCVGLVNSSDESRLVK